MNDNFSRWRRRIYHIRRHYLTVNNVVAAVALCIALSWIWGALGMMQRNFTLQHELDSRKREQKVIELEVQMLKYQQRYFQSNEYKELAAREQLGLVRPDEKVFILPPNTPAARALDTPTKSIESTVPPRPSNFQLWVNFLLGGHAESLQE